MKGTDDFGANYSNRDIDEAINPKLRLERQVIEAAKASKSEIDYVLKLATKMGVDYVELADLLEAVEALRDVEGQ